MSPLRPLPRTRLNTLIPSLVDGRALVVLYPASDDARWSAETAWSAARAAASSRRRVMLVDLDLEHPTLHQVVRHDVAPGIAEAFESGAPLNEAGRDPTGSGVFFLPAGSTAKPPAEIWANPRWEKLRLGFQSEQALLLAFLPRAAQPHFAATPDGVLVLTPDPDAPAEVPPAWAGFTLGRIVEPALPRPRSSTPPDRATPPLLPMAARSRPPHLAHPLAPTLLALGLSIAGLGTWAILAHSERWRSDAAHVAVPTPTIIPAAGPAPWTIRLAAYGTLQRAVAHVDRLAAQGVGAFVSPLPPDARGVVWYRVQAGAYTTREAADTARALLWERKLAPSGEGDLLLAPYSLIVEPPTHPEELRTKGLVGVRWGQAGPLLIGAFESADQAEYAAAALRAAGLQTTLVTRMGTHS